VAELHGGHATFVPGDGGRGCRFRIRLPVRVPEGFGGQRDRCGASGTL